MDKIEKQDDAVMLAHALAYHLQKQGSRLAADIIRAAIPAIPGMTAEALEAARKESAEATKAADTARANAAKSESGWMRQYAKRPESCKVALEALEVACGSYSSY